MNIEGQENNTFEIPDIKWRSWRSLKTWNITILFVVITMIMTVIPVILSDMLTDLEYFGSTRLPQEALKLLFGVPFWGALWLVFFLTIGKKAQTLGYVSSMFDPLKSEKASNFYPALVGLMLWVFFAIFVFKVATTKIYTLLDIENTFHSNIYLFLSLAFLVRYVFFFLTDTDTNTNTNNG